MIEQTSHKEVKKVSDATSGLLSSADLSVERLPMLQVLFEQLCDRFLDRLFQLSSAKVELSLQRVWTSSLSQLEINDDNHIAVQIEIEEGEAPALFSIDRGGLYLLLECMLGASGNERPYLETRDFTVLEFLFAKTIAARSGLAFCDAFDEITEFTTTVTTASKGSQVQTLLDPETSYLAARIVVDAFDRSGSIYILIPQAILIPLKNNIAVVNNHSMPASDHPWMEHIKSQFQNTDVTCQATLDGGTISLDAVSKLKVGQILKLDIPADNPVRFRSNEQDLFWCQLGQSEGVFTLKITDTICQQKNFLDEMLERQEQLQPSKI